MKGSEDRLDSTVTVLEVLRTLGPLSREALATGTHLSPATVSRAVRRLQREGLVREDPARGRGVGRPAQIVQLMPQGAYVVGVDAGGETIRAVLSTLDGSIVASAASLLHQPDDTAAAIAEIVRLVGEVRHARSERRVLAVGVGVSGIVDHAAGRVLLSPDLPGLEGVELASRLEEQLRLPVAIDNDDILAAVGEASVGAAVGCRDVVFLSLGYGLGAGILVDGRPVHGLRHAAGAIAYLAPGPLEERASGRVIPLRYLGTGQRSSGGPRRHPEIDLTAEEVFRRAATGDPVAEQVVADVRDTLGDLVVNVAAILNPEVVVLGGGLSRNGPALLKALSAQLSKVPFAPRLALSALGTQAVAIGASLLAVSVAKQRFASGGRQASPVRPLPGRLGALELA